MIYFFQRGVDGPVKIGWAKSWRSMRVRLATFQTACAEDLFPVGFYRPGSRDDEAELHDVFAEWRLRGEWFQPSPTIMWAAAHERYVATLLESGWGWRRWSRLGVVAHDGALTAGGAEYLLTLERAAAPYVNLDRTFDACAASAEDVAA